ncbi:MAG: ECF transporter S component, partial [Chloroflexota bacterium]
MTTTYGGSTAAAHETRWRTRDIVVAAVIGVAFGVVFWAWNLIY